MINDDDGLADHADYSFAEQKYRTAIHEKPVHPSTKNPGTPIKTFIQASLARMCAQWSGSTRAHSSTCTILQPMFQAAFSAASAMARQKNALAGQRYGLKTSLK